MKEKRSRRQVADEALQNLERWEAIVANTELKYGRVSKRLTEKLRDAGIDYAVAKDDLHDPFMKDEDE
jgi:hypothetical protein